MRALINSYVHYFNKKYERVGSLFQGIYKAVLIEEENYLLHLSRYIHLNPFEVEPRSGLNLANKLANYSYSSYEEYLGKRATKWVHPEEILYFFKTSQREIPEFKDILSYQSFVENYKEDSKEILGQFSID